MTCKDCIHYDICEIMHDQYGISKVSPSLCGYYKNATVVIVPPCKIGEPIYRVCSPRGTYHKPYVRKFKLTYKTLASTIEDFGKTVFRTREEAERVANGRKEAD